VEDLMCSRPWAISSAHRGHQVPYYHFKVLITHLPPHRGGDVVPSDSPFPLPHAPPYVFFGVRCLQVLDISVVPVVVLHVGCSGACQYGC
jgi:hypothetical protein